MSTIPDHIGFYRFIHCSWFTKCIPHIRYASRCRMIHDYIVSGFTKCIPHIRYASRCRMIHDYIVSGLLSAFLTLGMLQGVG